MPIAPSIEKLHAVKGMLVIFYIQHFTLGTLDWSSKPIQCVLCE